MHDSSAEQSTEPADVSRDPYAYVQREPLAATQGSVTATDYLIASVLSAFAGIVGLSLGAALAAGLLGGAILGGWLIPDERIRAWLAACLVACSLLFGPLLAVLAFRGHLKAVREVNRSRRPPEQS
jgi:uncharacterized membrane protein YfcA